MNIIMSCSRICINCILIFVKLVFTLISLCNLPLRPKQILIICLYDGFLVITGWMLKFVTKGDTEPKPSTSPGPSSTMSSVKGLFHCWKRLFIWFVPTNKWHFVIQSFWNGGRCLKIKFCLGAQFGQWWPWLKYPQETETRPVVYDTAPRFTMTWMTMKHHQHNNKHLCISTKRLIQSVYIQVQCSNREQLFRNPITFPVPWFNIQGPFTHNFCKYSLNPIKDNMKPHKTHWFTSNMTNKKTKKVPSQKHF